MRRSIEHVLAKAKHVARAQDELLLPTSRGSEQNTLPESPAGPPQEIEFETLKLIP